MMGIKILVFCCLATCTAFAMTEEEFDKLYKRLDKDADACYALYKAYRDGDGVEKNATRARKWLLGAMALGKPVQEEVATQPWRKKAKLPMRYKKKGSDEEIRANSQKICDMLHDTSKYFKFTMDRKEWEKQIETAVKECMDNGADPNFTAGPHTPLARAIDGNHPHLKVCKMLLDAGGDLHANGHTCWEAAAFSVGSRKVMKYPKNHINYRVPYDEVFKFCMKNGADLNMIDSYGRPMLMSAMRVSDPIWLEMLCKEGADPNIKGSKYEFVGPIDKTNYFYNVFYVAHGDAALHHATRNAKEEEIEILLRYGADPNLANDDGQNPLDIAKEALNDPTRQKSKEKFVRIISMLEEAAAAPVKQKASKKGKKKKKARK